MKIVLTLLLAIGWLCLPALQGNTFTLVENGEPRAVLLLPEAATEREQRAATELQSYLKAVSGADFTITHEAPAQGGVVHIGATKQGQAVRPADLDEDGFILKGVDARTFVIVGGSDWGTEYGVYELLERYLGVHWLMPTPLGTVIPQSKTVMLPIQEVREEPVFLNRYLSPIDIERTNYRKTSPWRQYQFSDSWGRYHRLRRRLAFHHNLLHLYPPSVFAKSNPEFYPLVDGRRRIPKNDKDFRWQPNFSTPGLAEAGIDRIVEHFREHPKQRTYSLAINDPSLFDESPASKARRSGKLNSIGREDVTDDYMEWANAVAKGVRAHYPGSQFGFLAYSNIFDPPQRVKVGEGLVPFLTYERLPWASPTARAWDQQRTLRWKEQAQVLGWYDYVYGRSYMLPRLWPHLMKEYLSWGAANGVRHYVAEHYPNWGEGPHSWMIAKLIWNPDRDVDALLQQWCELAVGKDAAPALLAYYAGWEQFWSKELPARPRSPQDIEPLWFRERSQWLPFLIPTYLLSASESLLQTSDQYMTEVVAKAGTQAEQARAQKLYAMWKIYQVSAEVYRGDNLWRYHQPTSEDEARRLLANCREVLGKASDRLAALEALREDDLHGHSIYRIMLRPDTAGKDWGATPLWTLLPWLAKSEALSRELAALAEETSLPTAKETIALIKHSAKEPMEGLLGPGNGFARGLQGWRATGVIEQDEAKVELTGGNRARLGQTVPISPGRYYLRLRTKLSESAPASGTAAIRMKTINAEGRDTGREQPALRLPLVAGTWREVILPFQINVSLDRPGTRLLFNLSLEEWPEGATLTVDKFQIYPVTSQPPVSRNAEDRLLIDQ